MLVRPCRTQQYNGSQYKIKRCHKYPIPFIKPMVKKGSGLMEQLGVLTDLDIQKSINDLLNTLKDSVAVRQDIFAEGIRTDTVASLDDSMLASRTGYPGERHMYLPTNLGLTRANYAGPGTNLKARLLRNDPPVDGPNGIDAAAKQHDIDYSKARTVSDVRSADKSFLKKVRRSTQSMPAKQLVIGAMKAKMFGEDTGIIGPEAFTKLDLEDKAGSGMLPVDRLKQKILKRSKLSKSKAKKISNKIKASRLFEKLK